MKMNIYRLVGVLVFLPFCYSLQGASTSTAEKAPVGSFMILFVLAALLYFIPSLIGILRKHHNLVGLIALNFFLGWTVLGWVGALVWSLLRTSKGTTIIHQHMNSGQGDVYSQLEKLKQLKESGALSEEEYNEHKSKLLQ